MFEKMKHLTFKKKLEYLWEYYHLHLIISVIFIILAGSIINSVFLNPAKRIYSSVSFFGFYIDQETLSRISEDLSNIFVADKKEYEVKTHAFYSIEADPEFEVAMGVKFFSMYTSGELDIIICDESYLDELINTGFLVNLDSFLDSETLIGFKEGHFVYETRTEQVPTILPYAVSLKNCSYITDNIGLDADNKFIGIVRNNSRNKQSAEIFKFLLTAK